VANLGTFLILAAFVTASGAFAACLAGARLRRNSLVQGGIGLFHVITALLLVASSVIVHAFVIGDYRIKYVQHYSNDQQPLFYKLASYWGGLDGSLLFWATLLAVFGSVAVHINRDRYRTLVPYVAATIAVVQMFFLFLLALHRNPFETFLTTAPTAGEGLNPLLQNFYMAIHPPLLYLGFVGMTIPFAFGIAALATGQLDDAWLKAVRRWTMTAWLFLTVGLALGGLWAYEELGWGGYWGWDPVENAGLLPWFTGTAFLHSVMVQERRGMLKIWNVSLVITTFFLTIFGTFMTRSGVVQSMHAFGEDRELAMMFTAFMIMLLVVSFGLVIYRLPLLRSRNELDSIASREAAFLANNWILLFSAFLILFATMFPTLSEAVTGERLTVATPFFNKWMTPIGLALLFLTGVGPLLAWRKSSVENLRTQFLWPLLAALVFAGGTWALGVPLWGSAICFGLCAMVTTTIAQEFIRGASVRQRTTGTDLFTALVGLFARSRRRYAGYIVHLGIVLIFFGFAGNGLERDEQIGMVPGQQLSLPPYTVKFKALTVTRDARKQMITAELDVLKDGKLLTSMYPARWYFDGRENEPTTEVALRRGFSGDLYLVLAAFDVEKQMATIEARINPLINWIWFGVGIMVIGTGIALLPERALSFATARVPENAVTTTLMLLLIVSIGSARLRAQHIVTPESSIIGAPRSDLEREIHKEIICMCGTCGRKLVGECTCATAAAMRNEIAALTANGKTRAEIIDYFVKKYGSQEVLGAPIDKGFNRLAWLFPYAVGAAGMVLAAAMAFRWSRRRAEDGGEGSHVAAAPASAAAKDLEARLDDELRDLD